MRRLWWVFGVLTVAACAVAQGGQGGFGGAGRGGFGGGVFGSGPTRLSREDIDPKVNEILEGRVVDSILTPGEYVEWTLKLKSDQVVYADASSAVFDPALEIFDGEKVVAENDDRYPGDQRPLLMWRCERAGDYRLRVRSFRGRAGGAVQVRHRVFDTHLLREGRNALEGGTRDTLVRLPMQAKQMVRVKVEASQSPGRSQLIGPSGLPAFGMVKALPIDSDPLTYAPVAGDYYWQVGLPEGVATTWAVETVKHTPIVLGKSYTESTNRALGAWKLDLKSGEAVTVSLDGLRGNNGIHLDESLDTQVFDLNDPERHPFTTPPTRGDPEDESYVPWYTKPMTRKTVLIAARKDTSIWLFADLRNVDRKVFKLSVSSPTLPFTGPSIQGTVLPGSMQVYEFNAKASEVYHLTSKSQNFLLSYFIVSPSLSTVTSVYQSDEENSTGLLLAGKTGRYLLFVTSVGHGGGGPFSINKTEIKPRAIGSGKPAAGSLAPGEVQVWSYEAQPGKPMVVRWVSSSGNVPLAAVDSEGKRVELPLTTERLDAQTQISFWLDQEPMSYRLVVRNPTDTRLDYRIEFSDLPKGTVSSGGMK